MVPPLINELYDHLQLNPRNVAVLELLVKTWLDHGTAGEKGCAAHTI